MTDIRKYFKELFKNHDSETLKSVLINVLDCKNKVARDVRAGKVQVNEDQADINQVIRKIRQQNQNQIKSKRLLLQKEIQSLKRQQFQSDQAYKRAKQQLIIQRQQQIKQQKQQRQRKQRQIQQKVKRWSQEQKQIIRKKQLKLQQQLKSKEIQQQRNKLRNQEQKINYKNQKRKQIQQKLKQIQQNRLKREQAFVNTKSQSQDKIPLYIQYEKKAKQIQYEKNFEQNIQKKNNKFSMKVDYQALKQHQREFLARIQERSKKFEQSRTRATSSLPDYQFSLYTNRSQEKVKQQLEKQKRRWKYQEKIKAIPIEIDESKKVKIQIALDKSKNPFKYNFLSQKSLNQFQIFGEFKNFSINSDPKQIGKNYLQELKKIPKQSRIEKSSSLQIIKQTSVSDRPKYRNYLAQIRTKRPETEQQKDQIKKIVSNKNKQKAATQLEKKSIQLQENLHQKIKQLKTLNSGSIKNILKKQSQIDEAYAKALKARLAILQLSSS